MSRSSRAIGLLLLVALATLLAGAGLPRLRVAADLEGSLYGHPAQAELNAFRAQFGNLESLFAFYPVPRLDVSTLGELFDAVARLRAAPGVKRVVSLLDFLPRPCRTRGELEAYLHEGRALERFLESL